MSRTVIEAIRTRRVTRFFNQGPVSKSDLGIILDAGRWAPSAGNRRPQKFIVVQNPRTINLIRWVAPGIVDHPVVLIVICTDWRMTNRSEAAWKSGKAYIDVGTTAENMLLAAASLGLGAGPVTSFSQAALAVLLEIPPLLSPDLIICLGHPAANVMQSGTRPSKVIRWQDLTYWERYESNDSFITPRGDSTH